MKRLSHLVCLFALFAFVSSNLQAQITIGNGTSYSQKTPTNGYYKYSWSSSIYLANEINTSGSISSIAFYVDHGTANFTMDNQRIYIRQTSASSYSNSTYDGPAGFTEVYNGSISFVASGWQTIVLATPFQYDGTSNLEILMENRDGTWADGFPYFRFTNTSTSRTKRDFQDEQFPVTCPNCTKPQSFPNLQLSIQSCSFAAGTTSASLSNVTAGNPTLISLAGQDANASIQWQVSTDNIHFKNIAGATGTSVSHSPNATSYYRALLTANACSKVSPTTTVTVDLTGMITRSVGTGTQSTSRYPFNNYWGNGWSSMLYKASEINGAGKLSRIALQQENTLNNLTIVHQRIYVRHTSEQSFANSTYPGTSGFTLVYDGDMQYGAAGWKEIVFDKAFVYNGTDNLEFLFENGANAYANEFPYFLGEEGNQTDYRIKRDYNDNVFPVTCSACTRYKNRLNIQFKLFPCGGEPIVATSSATAVLTGASAVVSVSGQSAEASIQWQSSLDNTTFTDISGATTASYTTANLLVATYYKAVVTSNGCPASSNVLSITVDESSLVTAAIGTGSETYDKYPFYGYYDYSWSTALYKAAEINTTGKLTRISLYVANDPINVTMQNQKIYARHTSTSEYQDGAYPNSTDFKLVYNGAITYNGTGWKEIVLQTAFDYNGVDDLEFLFENRDGSWSSYYPTFRGQGGMPENRVKRDYEDYNFPSACKNCEQFNNILNVQLKFVPCTLPAAVISSATTSARQGESVTFALVTDQPAASIQWETSADNFNFHKIEGATAASFTTAMTGTPLYVRAETTDGCSQYSNVLSIAANNCYMNTASIGTATGSGYKYPFNVYYDHSWASTIYYASEIGQAGTLSSISFNVTNEPTNYVTHNQKIYVRHTTATEYLTNGNPLQDVPQTGEFTLVYEGDIVYRGGGWKEIPFTLPFVYDGTSNLEFLFENRDGSYGTDYPTFAYTSGQPVYRVKRDYADDTFPTDCSRYGNNCSRSLISPDVRFRFAAPSTVGGTTTASQTEICPGETTELRIVGYPEGATIQWQYSNDNVVFEDVEGAVGSVYNTANLNTVSYFRAKVMDATCFIVGDVVTINMDCKVTAIFDETTGLGTIGIDISGIEDKVGPYHYMISEYPIPEMTEMYAYLRDSIYGDSVEVDSASYFMGNNNETSYQFPELVNDNYFIACFDSRGKRILTREFHIQLPFLFEPSAGIRSEQKLIISEKNDAKGVFPTYISEQTNGSFSYSVLNPNENQFFGLIADELQFNSFSNLNYGFLVADEKVFLVENGIQSSDYFNLTNNGELQLVQNNGKIEYYLSNQLLKSATLPTGEFVLKTGVGFEKSGTKIKLVTKKVKYKRIIFNHYEAHGGCDYEYLSFRFRVKLAADSPTFPGPYQVAFTITSPNGYYLSGTSYTGTENQIQIFPTTQYQSGVYTVAGTIAVPSENGVQLVPFSETLYLGYITMWPFVHNYYFDIDYETNGLKKEFSLAPNYAAGVSSNIIFPSETGWVTFKPVMTQVSAELASTMVFTTNPGAFPSWANIWTDVYFSFTKISNTKYRIYARGFNPSNPSQNMAYAEIFNLSAGTDIRVILTQSTIQLWVNDQLKWTSARPYGQIRLKATSMHHQDGFNHIVASFNCFQMKHPLSKIGYTELKKEISAGYATAVEGKVKFTFDEEYKIENGSHLPLKIYNDQHQLLVQSDLNGVVTDVNNVSSTYISSSELAYKFDDNRYILTISGLPTIAVGEYFTIEVLTSTGDKRFLRIYYKSQI